MSASVLCPGPIATNIARGARNRPDHMGGPRCVQRRGGAGGAPRQHRPRSEAGRRARGRRDPHQDLLRLRQRRARRRHQGAPPPHRGGARVQIDDVILRANCVCTGTLQSSLGTAANSKLLPRIVLRRWRWVSTCGLDGNRQRMGRDCDDPDVDFHRTRRASPLCRCHAHVPFEDTLEGRLGLIAGNLGDGRGGAQRLL